MPRTLSTPKTADQGAILHGYLDAASLGWLALSWSPAGLVAIQFRDRAPSAEARLDAAPIPEVYAGTLGRYFRGEPVDPALLPVDLSGTAFQLRVWNALRKIPRGRVKSYGSVAAEIGSPRGMRAVGMANARNPVPIVVPCHRVVETGMALGGYSAGIARKVKLLALEGVKVEQGRVLCGQLDLWKA